MDKITETWITTPAKPVSRTNQQACLVHIYPTGLGMGTRYTLGKNQLVIGRNNDCDIYINDNSVSRQHARIQPSSEGFEAVDLESTNGTFVNDRDVTQCLLRDGDYLRIGNTIYRFLSGGNVESEYHEEIYRLTIIDALTDIHNKRYLLEFLDRELARSSRHKRPLSLVMMDIDRFKSINDELGHLGGDFTLRELTLLIKRTIRREELFARYGGEEFAAVLPETAADGAITFSERVRELVGHHTFCFDGASFPVTISLGVATTLGEDGMTPTKLIRLADEKLYLAKRQGRNCVVS